MYRYTSIYMCIYIHTHLYTHHTLSPYGTKNEIISMRSRPILYPITITAHQLKQTLHTLTSLTVSDIRLLSLKHSSRILLRSAWSWFSDMTLWVRSELENQSNAGMRSQSVWSASYNKKILPYEILLLI